jgi:hypothetical protein
LTGALNADREVISSHLSVLITDTSKTTERDFNKILFLRLTLTFLEQTEACDNLEISDMYVCVCVHARWEHALLASLHVSLLIYVTANQ